MPFTLFSRKRVLGISVVLVSFLLFYPRLSNPGTTWQKLFILVLITYPGTYSGIILVDKAILNFYPRSIYAYPTSYQTPLPKSLRIRTILLDYIWDTISLLAIEKMMACY